MAESAIHQEYVRKIVRYLSSLGIDKCQADLPECNGRTPKVIGGYFPDVYYSDMQCIFIGEAKTSKDIDNIHTQRQIGGYVEEMLAYDCERNLIFCSSVYDFARLVNYFQNKKKAGLYPDIRIHIIDNFNRVTVI